MPDNSRRTALMLAAQWNTPEVVNALLDAGADVKARDNFGKTALDYAGENAKLIASDVIDRMMKLTKEAV